MMAPITRITPNYFNTSLMNIVCSTHQNKKVTVNTVNEAFGNTENIVGKAQNYGTQNFLLFPKCFFFKEKDSLFESGLPCDF